MTFEFKIKNTIVFSIVLERKYELTVLSLRGKVKTKHDITWFAQKTNVDQLNSAYVYDSGGVKIFLLFTL
jgi:hypothetical protein